MTIPAARAARNCRHLGPDRRGAGSMPAARRISHTVDGATVTPSFVSSPRIRRCPHSGFSWPGERQGGRCPGPSAGGRACAACSCRTCCRRVCGARPGASRASRGRRLIAMPPPKRNVVIEFWPSTSPDGYLPSFVRDGDEPPQATADRLIVCAAGLVRTAVLTLDGTDNLPGRALRAWVGCSVIPRCGSAGWRAR